MCAPAKRLEDGCLGRRPAFRDSAGGAESLNAAGAAGIMIYDLYRVQRQGES